MKAVNIANVDERVNKAVAAANKAANAARVAAVKAVQNQMHHDNCISDFPMQIVWVHEPMELAEGLWRREENFLLPSDSSS